VTDEIGQFKNEINVRFADIMSQISQVETDNMTTRALVKRQTDEFATVYSMIEISKANIERLQKSLETLPVIGHLQETDEYLLKYLPFKIQNMIDDTLFGVMNALEVNKLVAHEQSTFHTLMVNLKTLNGKLCK